MQTITRLVSYPSLREQVGVALEQPNHTMYGMTRMHRKATLGDFELTVLLAILHLEDDAYGGEILREIDQRTGRAVPGGALYVTLDRMESKGFIESRLADPTPNRGGRPRRYVAVTEKGFEAVRESREALLSMMSGLDALFRER